MLILAGLMVGLVAKADFVGYGDRNCRLIGEEKRMTLG